MKSEVLKPKGKFDKLCLRVEQQRLWESLPGAITRVWKIVARAEQIRTADLEPREKTAQLKALELQLKALTTTILDRTIPTVARVHQTGQIDHTVRQQTLADVHRQLIEEDGEAIGSDSRIH